MFEEVKCWYLAKLLDVGLNAVPVSEKKFDAMSEQDFQAWLKKTEPQ